MPSGSLHHFMTNNEREAADTKGRVAVGRINGAWGLRGHVKVTPYTSNAERFRPDSVLLLDGVPARVLDVRTPKGYPCVQFEGYRDRTAAGTLAGTIIEVEESELPELPEGEHYVYDLIGLTVVTTDGDAIGRLHQVLHTAANDVYLVRRPGAKDALVPAIADVVVEIDIAGGRMVIDPLPGLLDG